MSSFLKLDFCRLGILLLKINQILPFSTNPPPAPARGHALQQVIAMVSSEPPTVQCLLQPQALDGLQGCCGPGGAHGRSLSALHVLV